MIKDIFDKQVMELKKLWANKRQLLFQLLNLAMIVFSALMIWKALMCYTKVRNDSSCDFFELGTCIIWFDLVLTTFFRWSLDSHNIVYIPEMIFAEWYDADSKLFAQFRRLSLSTRPVFQLHNNQQNLILWYEFQYWFSFPAF